MKIKANGITINYQIDGPDGAPWLVFSNSLATSLAMWDEQAAALKDSYRVLRYDQRGHGGNRRAGRPLCLTIRCLPTRSACSTRCRSRRRISPACRWAAPPRSDLPSVIPTVSTASSSATRRANRRRRSSQQWEERIAVAQKTGHRGVGRADRFALGSAGNPGEESAACRQDPRHDPRHAGQRLHRLRRGAGRPRLRLRRRHA